jgi:hypothetical protein
MKWIRTRNGEKAHAVSRKASTTLCGIALSEHAAAIVTPGIEDRCDNCDREWRERGKKTQPKKRQKTTERRSVYLNRFTYRDWEEV